MAYLSADGTLQKKRSPWRVSIIADLFWGILNFILMFFQTMTPGGRDKHLGPQQSAAHGGAYKRSGGARLGSGPAKPKGDGNADGKSGGRSWGRINNLPPPKAGG